MFLKSLNPVRRIRQLLEELCRAREEGERARQRIEQLEQEKQRLEEEGNELREEIRRLCKELETRTAPVGARLLRSRRGKPKAYGPEIGSYAIHKCPCEWHIPDYFTKS